MALHEYDVVVNRPYPDQFLVHAKDKKDAVAFIKRVYGKRHSVVSVERRKGAHSPTDKQGPWRTPHSWPTLEGDGT